MKPENFAVFILTHGRPFQQLTFSTFLKAGYTGKIYFILDNEDSKLKEYKEAFGDNVIVFDKEKTAQTTDRCDNFEGRKAIVFARNACFKIAEQLGIRYFMQCDDDYKQITYRFDSNGHFETYKPIKNLDAILYHLLEFYKASNIKSVAIAQTGEFVGGEDSNLAADYSTKRKCMNTWICDTQKPFAFTGRLNEDCTAYCIHGSRGDIFLQINSLVIGQIITQKASGGMSEAYALSGTYNNTFYTIMQCPSFVQVSEIGQINKRLHHFVHWNKAIPKILNESTKKL